MLFFLSIHPVSNQVHVLHWFIIIEELSLLTMFSGFRLWGICSYCPVLLYLLQKHHWQYCSDFECSDFVVREWLWGSSLKNACSLWIDSVTMQYVMKSIFMYINKLLKDFYYTSNFRLSITLFLELQWHILCFLEKDNSIHSWFSSLRLLLQKSIWDGMF